jgi:hypothetical protein
MLKMILPSLLFVCSLVIAKDSSLPPPYNEVDLVPFNDHGFYSNAGRMENMFKLHNPKVVIEVGCWIGESTRHFASLLPPGGVVYAVDHWLGSEEHQPGQVFWYPFVPYLYRQFLSNVIHAKLTDKIVPVRMTSLEASEYLSDVVPDIIYIDASHDFDAVYADLKAWYPLVKGHGLLCGDDWGTPGVHQAVIKFAQEQGLKIEAPYSTFWYYVE